MSQIKTFGQMAVTARLLGGDADLQTDLSFCDLPGLIASVSREGKESDIKLVESLVTSYILKPSCIILLTVACETDFENQGAHRLAKQCDPDGKRTIGVLTKPDRIPTGEESSWLPFIHNEKESLENNWYCVKQPGSSDIKQGITWAQARSREDEFFSMTPPWSELDGIYQKYLRTSNLVDRLSSILSDLISKRLPEIQKELEKSIHQARTAFNQLPKEPSKQPMNEIFNLLHTFVNDLAVHVEGIPDHDGLIQHIKPAQQKFRVAIRATAPNFMPFEKNYAGKKKLPLAEFLENEEELGLLESEDEGNSLQGVPTKTKRGIGMPHSRKNDTRAIYVDDIMERAHQARTRELPGNFPFIVQKTYINQFLSRWRSPALALCKTIHAKIAEHVKTLTKKHFGSFGQGGLEQRVKTSSSHFSKAVVNRTGIAKVLAGLTELGMPAIKPEDLPKLLPSDPMEPALVIMADVRAYFQIAYKCFTDNVPLAVNHELVIGAERGVLKLLYGGLGINGPNGLRICKDLAQESPQNANRREELMKKLERLNVANSIHRSYRRIQTTDEMLWKGQGVDTPAEREMIQKVNAKHGHLHFYGFRPRLPMFRNLSILRIYFINSFTDADYQAGVKYVMVFEGVNDIGTTNSDAASQQQVGDQLIVAFQQIVRDAKAAGLKVFAATITLLGSGYTAIVGNPSNPSQLAQQHDSGNGLHPNVTGYQAIANQFPLDLLTGSAPPSSTTSSSPPTSTTSSAPPVTTTTSTPPATTSPTAQATHYAQCGGKGYTGPTVCQSPWTCKVSNKYYSQCL
ncbi:hypothetical protein BDQ12DRAFT_715805 [Crucibulum laeve]|uniref:P-loop containing nucleoside triphosphate hydrolase protein n=1 Tax=Crucibulum laeve TaxID=68775 RepID=A0A5C3LNG4_9AGAR|nr:hypothetical protein BDQ12DRAFT_715805 [Crucibulum laeve]